MRNLIRPVPFLVILGVAILIAGANAVRSGILTRPAAPPKGITTVSWAQVQAGLSNQGAILLDVRPEAVYEAGHLPKALSMALDRLPQRLEALRLNANDRYILYCDGGDCHASIQAAKALVNFGFRHVAVYEGGWDDYTNRTRNPGVKP